MWYLFNILYLIYIRITQVTSARTLHNWNCIVRVITRCITRCMVIVKIVLTTTIKIIVVIKFAYMIIKEIKIIIVNSW
uniref:Secreted protein n=1 Tax=Panstrongylus lignarius TaxID=156445 RepID=A0A224XWT3_9HEMI